MMMCIGGISDFEAQLTVSEELEAAERGATWLLTRLYADEGLDVGVCMRRFEPARPYSHGRRFIPAWLIADREFYMAAAISCDYHGSEARHRLYGLVRVDVDTTVMVRRK